MTVQVYIGIGSNLGNRKDNIARAINMLACKHKVVVSSLYETDPEEYIEQPLFLNCVVGFKTSQSAFKLLENLKDLERHLGRKRSFRNAPRTIDLDILFYDGQIIKDPDLEVPHPRLHKRAFVLAPFVEIAPEFIHPVLHKSIRQLYDELQSPGNVRRLEESINIIAGN